MSALIRIGFFFFNDTATTEIYTLSLHDALPILAMWNALTPSQRERAARRFGALQLWRSEEHTSELQSRPHLVCRLLLEKKKQHAVTPPLRPAAPAPPSRQPGTPLAPPARAAARP